jgi:hypothetical protein
MNSVTKREDSFPQATLKKAAIEFLAAGSSVTAYHPFKNIGQQIFKGIDLNLTPKALYRGFLGSALAAHQLFLMGTLDGFLQEIFHIKDPSQCQKIGIGALAGALTTFTVTPCEMMAIQKQNKDPLLLNTLFRGGVPLFFRQTGLGAGMLTGPSALYERCKTLFPEFTQEHEKSVKIGSSLSVGAAAAAMTQIFEQARVMMQNDPLGETYKDAKTALQKAPDQMLSTRGRHMFAIRLATVAIATLVLSAARETYPILWDGDFFHNKFIFNKENKS